MSKNTVYIIGAGASLEAGLPTGEQLKNTISNLLSPKKLKGNVQLYKSILSNIKKENDNVSWGGSRFVYLAFY